MKPHAGRCLLVWLGATAAAAGLLAMALPDVLAAVSSVQRGSVSAEPFDRVLVWTAATAAAVGTTWLWSTATLVVGEALRGTPRAAPGVPRWVRRAVLMACGVAVIGAGAPAMATPGAIHTDQTGDGGSAVVRGLPLPERPVDGPPRTAVRQVLVQPGDTLWSIAQRQLDPSAPEADVAARWHRLYVLNRDVIGADPDLIQPGQHLRTPAGPDR